MPREAFHRRFDSVGRLLGDDAMERSVQAHVMVIGTGGKTRRAHHLAISG